MGYVRKKFNYLEELNPEGFTFDQYTLQVGYNISQVFYVDDGIFRIKNGFIIIGYCDAGKLHIRPRPGEYAVKILHIESDTVLWMHLMEYQMEILEENEKKCLTKI